MANYFKNYKDKFWWKKLNNLNEKKNIQDLESKEGTLVLVLNQQRNLK